MRREGTLIWLEDKTTPYLKNPHLYAGRNDLLQLVPGEGRGLSQFDGLDGLRVVVDGDLVGNEYVVVDDVSALRLEQTMV